jgi:hypothetical protein
MTVELLTTVLVAADDQTLVDLATVKEELSLDPNDTSDDGWLTRSIGQVSRSISNFCNRTFQIEQLRDLAYIQQDPYPYQTPGGVGVLQLSRWPLANFTLGALRLAAQPGDRMLAITDDSQPDGVISGPGLALGSTATVAGQTATLSLPVKAAMPAGTPIAFGIEVKQTTSLAAAGASENALSAGIDYAVDANKGELIRLNSFTGVATLWEALPTTITYSAGFDAVPDDVVVAALRWMVLRKSERSRDPMLREFNEPLIGTKTYWVGGPPTSGGVPQEIAALLGNYRTPVIA